MSSLASKTMPFLIGLRGVQKPYDSAAALQEQAAALLLRPKSFNPPSKLDRTVDLSARLVGGWRVYELTPKGTAPKRRALFLHRGAYLHEIQQTRSAQFEVGRLFEGEEPVVHLMG